jgi:arylsulfatase A-like enzyme
MNRRQFLLTTAATALSGQTAQPLNFILVLLDDLGWRDFGAYGNVNHDTPEVDRLAREGVRFTNYYSACPVCSPTRASIMTGKYPARLHLTDWIPGRKQWPKAKLLVPEFEQQLPHAETTIAEALKPLGYRTASTGKWHLGGGDFTPDKQGFDLNYGGNHRGGIPTFFGPFALPGMEGTTKGDYITDKLNEAAEKFIGESVAARQPFFVYLPHYTPHIPLSAKEELIEKYQRKFGDKEFPNATYAAMIEGFDATLGSLRRKLDSLGVAKNTVIMLTSDNGGLRYEGARKQLVTENTPLRAGKGHMYEGGIRDPLIVLWPGVTKAGVVIDTPVCSIDLMPTVLDIAGAKNKPSMDGVSLASLLRGGRAPAREALYWHYPHYSNQGGVPAGAVRKGEWKLIEFYEDGRLELYNLKSDPGEKRNLVKLEPKRAAEFHALLKRWRESVNATMPQPNPAYDPLGADQGLTGAEPVTPPAS